MHLNLLSVSVPLICGLLSFVLFPVTSDSLKPFLIIGILQCFAFVALFVVDVVTCFWKDFVLVGFIFAVGFALFYRNDICLMSDRNALLSGWCHIRLSQGFY